MLAVGIDLGTSGVRCAAVNSAGTPVALASVPMPAPITAWNRPAQDPEIWWGATTECLRQLIELLEQSGHSATTIESLAVDGTSGTMLLVDAALQPLTPGLMYHSGGFHRQAEQIKEVAPANSITLGSGSGLARLMFLLEQSAPSTVAAVLHQADWIAARLRGTGFVSDETNSLKTGYDPLEQGWPEWISQLVPPQLLPTVVPSGSATGTCSGASECRLLPGVRLIAGVTDSNAAFLASGASRPGDGVTSLGSTLVIKLLSNHPVTDPGRGIYSHRIGNMWLPGGASNTGGTVLRQHFSNDQLQALSEHLQPETPTRLDYYPLPDTGERFPVCDPQLQPNLSPRPDDDVVFLQGILESMARIEKAGYKALADLGAPQVQRIFSAGGGAVNSAWTDIRARVLNCALMEAKHTEAAVGTARLAAGLVQTD